MFADIKAEEGIATEKDSVGTGGVFDSDLYEFTVKLAYGTVAASGARGLVVNLEAANKRTLRTTLWMTSGKEKGGKNYYEKDGVKHYLQGYLLAESLALLTVGKPISEIETEEKVAKIYDFDAKAEVPTKVQMAVELIGKPILAGVLKQVVDKNVKQADGSYAPSGQTREENEIDKFFRVRDRMTTAEIRAQAEVASFVDTWVEKNKGRVVNKAKGAGGTVGAPKAGGAGAAAGTAKPKTSLFA
jgi:hypothetical protein